MNDFSEIQDSVYGRLGYGCENRVRRGQDCEFSN